MSNKYFLGADPGAKGCICLLSDDKKTIKFFDAPKDRDYRTYFHNIEGYIVENDIEVVYGILERVHAMPKQGISSTFTFGQNYGRYLTFLDIYDVPYQTVLPQVWQKNMLSKHDGITTKTQSYVMAKRMFPTVQLTGPKGGVLDGRADSLLISVYASKQV